MGANQSSQQQPKGLPARDYHPGIGGMSREPPGVSNMEGREVHSELYPYGLPTPPKIFMFGGAGWGYGIGCTTGPFLGIGSGYGLRGGILFGAGVGIGGVCGVGFGSGLLTGLGTAYIPIGINFSTFYTPKFIRLERAVESLRLRRIERRDRNKGDGHRVFDSLPESVQGWIRGLQKITAAQIASAL